MKIVLAGGTGHLGQLLARDLVQRGDEIVVLSRGGHDVPSTMSGTVRWDGRHLGPWMQAIDGADAVVNLAGRSVNCRYTKTNLQEMMGSRVDSTRAIGQAIRAAARPPRIWLQMSTATIYAHRFDAPAATSRTRRSTGGPASTSRRPGSGRSTRRTRPARARLRSGVPS
jgi:NAD dependent epimerase/dehydratase family enzyme